jgi:hypothetical protein
MTKNTFSIWLKFICLLNKKLLPAFTQPGVRQTWMSFEFDCKEFVFVCSLSLTSCSAVGGKCDDEPESKFHLSHLFFKRH